MNEPFVPSMVEEAIKGTPEERVDEIARAIQREPWMSLAIAAVVGFVLALVVR